MEEQMSLRQTLLFCLLLGVKQEQVKGDQEQRQATQQRAQQLWMQMQVERQAVHVAMRHRQPWVWAARTRQRRSLGKWRVRDRVRGRQR